MGDDFSSGPGTFPGACFPEVGGDSVSRPEQAALRAAQFLEDGFERWHDVFWPKNLTFAGLKAAVLQRGSAGLLESLRQLQDATFPERRTENLQTDRKLSTDFATRYGNPWDPG
jgi:hypothetical protein